MSRDSRVLTEIELLSSIEASMVEAETEDVRTNERLAGVGSQPVWVARDAGPGVE